MLGKLRCTKTLEVSAGADGVVGKSHFFFAGFALVWGFPVIFLVVGLQVFLLVVYLLSVTGFFLTLRMFLCSRCMNFACPLNRVKDDVCREFFKCNPRIAEAWKHETTKQ